MGILGLRGGAQELLPHRTIRSGRECSRWQTPHAVVRRGLLKPRDPDTLYGWLNEIAGAVSATHLGWWPDPAHPFVPYNPAWRQSMGDFSFQLEDAAR